MIDRLKKHTFKIIIFLLIMIIVLTLIYVKFIREVAYLVFVSFLLAYFLKPIYKAICKKIKLNKRLIAAIVVFSTFGLIILISIMLVSSLIKEWNNIDKILDSIEELFENLENNFKFKDFNFVEVINNQIFEKINVVLYRLSTNGIDDIINVGENLMAFAIVPFISYYFLADGKKMIEKIFLLLPVSKKRFARDMTNNIDVLLGKYIFSQIILCGIIGVLTFIPLFFMGVPLPLWLSFINAVFNLVPYFGPIIGAIPAIIVALIKSKTLALWTAGILFAIQQVEGNVICPLITAYSVKLHPLSVIVLVLIGEKFGGIFGMILAIPVGVIIKQVYEDINYYLY